MRDIINQVKKQMINSEKYYWYIYKNVYTFHKSIKRQTAQKICSKVYGQSINSKGELQMAIRHLGKCTISSSQRKANERAIRYHLSLVTLVTKSLILSSAGTEVSKTDALIHCWVEYRHQRQEFDNMY